MTNSDIIKERLLQIDENLKLLDDLRKTNKEDFQKDLKSLRTAERCLEINIQAILDICHYLIANNNWPRPSDNKEAIEIIAKYKVIPEDFAKTLFPMVGLRNLLVHEYVKISPALIYEHLQKIQDFRTFQKYILAYLKNQT